MFMEEMDEFGVEYGAEDDPYEKNRSRTSIFVTWYMRTVMRLHGTTTLCQKANISVLRGHSRAPREHVRAPLPYLEQPIFILQLSS